MRDMNIEEAYKVLVNAKSGNSLSGVCYNEWAKCKRMPILPSSEYDKVNSYDDFYDLAYYCMFGT
jgi:hypothetical protein